VNRTSNHGMQRTALRAAVEPKRSVDLKSLDSRRTWGEWIEMEYTEQRKADFRQRFGQARGKANGLRLFAP
jgi:hypothetical protein